MSACEIYYKNKIQSGNEHLINFVTKEEFEKEIYKSFPLLIIREEDFISIYKMAKNFYVGFDKRYFKVTDCWFTLFLKEFKRIREKNGVRVLPDNALVSV